MREKVDVVKVRFDPYPSHCCEKKAVIVMADVTEVSREVSIAKSNARLYGYACPRPSCGMGHVDASAGEVY